MALKEFRTLDFSSIANRFLLQKFPFEFRAELLKIQVALRQVLNSSQNQMIFQMNLNLREEVLQSNLNVYELLAEFVLHFAQFFLFL